MAKIVSDLTDMVPPTIDHAVGSPFRLLKEYLTFFWEEKAKGSSLSFGPLIFFSSLPGAGKHLASILVARELGLKYWEIMPPEIVQAQKREDLTALLMAADQYVIYLNCGRYLFGPVYEDYIFQLLTHNKAYLGDNPFEDPVELDPMPEVVVVLGTEKRELVERLRSRIRVIRFGEYSEDEFKKIYTDKLKMAGWTVSEDALTQLLECSGNNIGLGVRHLEMAYLLARNLGREVISIAHIQKAHQLLYQNEYFQLPPKP
jgi:Holliday junction resolvasome RuvABC ATP-dependent DNA helicase subunit